MLPENTMDILLRRLRLVAFCALCLVAVSCTSLRYQPLPETGASLEGTVTYGKEKVLAALIIIAGKDGSATGNIGDDGRYKVDNVPLGEVTIAVNTSAAKAQAMGARASRVALRFVDVPARYRDPINSGIKTTVAKGTNTFDIVIPTK
jgi:hypothetical protein